MAASCALRRFDDAYVARLPSDRSIEKLRARYPDVRIEILATEGEWLSQCMQDGVSPSNDSTMRRYIQPAEPVYQLHPPRPACGGTAYTSAAITYGSTL